MWTDNRERERERVMDGRSVKERTNERAGANEKARICFNGLSSKVDQGRLLFYSDSFLFQSVGTNSRLRDEKKAVRQCGVVHMRAETLILLRPHGFCFGVRSVSFIAGAKSD